MISIRHRAHSYEPQTTLAATSAWVKANSKDVSLVLTCTQLNNDEKRTRAARRPTSGNPPSSSAIQCSE